MKRWQRLTLTLFGVLAASLWLLFKALDMAFGGLCSTTVFQSLTSPDGRAKAVLYEIDCGATTDFNRQIGIVGADFDPKAKHTTIPDSVFHARGTPEVRLKWLDGQRLEVAYPADAEVSKAEQRAHGVRIDYKTTR